MPTISYCKHKLIYKKEETDPSPSTGTSSNMLEHPFYSSTSVLSYFIICFDSSLHAFAICGRTDFVGDGYTTLWREASSQAIVDARDLTSQGFQTVADPLAVGGGRGCRIKSFQPTAASCRHSPTLLEVAYTLCQAAWHLATWDGSFC